MDEIYNPWEGYEGGVRVKLPVPLETANAALSTFLEDVIPCVVSGERVKETAGLVSYSMRTRLRPEGGEVWYRVDLHHGGKDTTRLYVWIPTPGPSGKSRGNLSDFSERSLQELLKASDEKPSTGWQAALRIVSWWLSRLEEYETQKSRGVPKGPIYDRDGASVKEGWNSAVPTRTEEEKGDHIRIPKRRAVRRKWVRTWALVRRQVEEAKPYEEICEWLRKMHPELTCSPETLADIIKAGERGMLKPTLP